VPTGPGKDRTLKNKKIKANLNMHEPNHKIIIVRKTIQSLLKKKKLLLYLIKTQILPKQPQQESSRERQKNKSRNTVCKTLSFSLNML